MSKIDHTPITDKIDHTPITEKGHARTMDSEFQTLTREEFASLLSVGHTSAASIPFEHELRLTMLGYIADLDGRLRFERRAGLK
jgi:hypothetical protein